MPPTGSPPYGLRFARCFARFAPPGGSRRLTQTLTSRGQNTPKHYISPKGICTEIISSSFYILQTGRRPLIETRLYHSLFYFSFPTFHFSFFIFHFSFFVFHFSLSTFHFSFFTFHFSLFVFRFSLFRVRRMEGP